MIEDIYIFFAIGVHDGTLYVFIVRHGHVRKVSMVNCSDVTFSAKAKSRMSPRFSHSDVMSDADSERRRRSATNVTASSEGDHAARSDCSACNSAESNVRK